MKKEQAQEVKNLVDKITGLNYTKTFSSKSETLHICIGTYPDRLREESAEWIKSKEAERKKIIKSFKTYSPKYDIKENNKRYQGFINDICITIK